LTSVLAAVLVALSLAYCLRVLARCNGLSQAALTEQPTERPRDANAEDELEQRLAEKELTLQLGLGRRLVRALARATLFTGTGLAVWELTSGSSHYLPAGVAFILGFVGWAGAGEVERRIGSLAERRKARVKNLAPKRNQQGDKPFRTS
jgi:hypothetical protein